MHSCFIYFCSLHRSEGVGNLQNGPVVTVTKMLWKHKGLFYENCETWYHASCQGMHSVIYEVAHLSTVEWKCTNCGVTNFSSTIFDLSSLEHSNSFSVISNIDSVSSLGSPQAASSPVSNPSNPAKAPTIPTQTATHQVPCNSKLGNALHVVNINFQSVMAKRLNCTT